MTKIFRSALLILLLSSSAIVIADDLTDRNVIARTPLRKFGDKAHVAFLGGSITEMEGHRPIVCRLLEERFPDTEFTFTAAGISSTCSMTGAFRLERDIFSQGPVDLLFVEFAVNDDQDAGHDEAVAIRSMEGIVRHIKHHNPKADVVMTFFANEHLIGEYRAGREATSIAAHRKVAEHYGIPTVDVAREVQQQIDDGVLTWQQYGGVHPAERGNRLAAEMMATLFRDMRSDDEIPPLPEPLDARCYQFGRFLSPDRAEFDETLWHRGVPDWKSIPGSFRRTFADQPFLCCETPGAELTLKFSGSCLGVYILAGPDAGELEFRIDDGPAKTAKLYHHFSEGLHYPRSVMLADDLPPGKHRVRIRSRQGEHGSAVRIMQFNVNDPAKPGMENLR